MLFGALYRRLFGRKEVTIPKVPAPMRSFGGGLVYVVAVVAIDNDRNVIIDTLMATKEQNPNSLVYCGNGNRWIVWESGSLEHEPMTDFIGMVGHLADTVSHDLTSDNGQIQ